MNNNITSLLKVCVYKINDSYNYIGVSSNLTNNDKGCYSADNKFYELVFSFYAFNISIRPLPAEISIIKNRQSTINPIATGVTDIMYDIYNENNLDTSVFFGAYVSPVNGTIPIYIWYNKILDSSIFTLDKNYKPADINWKETLISPIYGIDKIDSKFTCTNFTCIPYDEGSNILFQSKPYDNIDDCLSGCALHGRKQNMLKLPSLTESLKDNYIEKYTNTQKNPTNYNVVLLIVLIVIIILLILITIYLIYLS